MNGRMPAAMADTAPLGLSSSEAARRLSELGPPADTSSRSTRSIIYANVFTLFNAIVLVFFILVISQGLFADALFGLIATPRSASARSCVRRRCSTASRCSSLLARA
jgi:hypothetical protein